MTRELPILFNGEMVRAILDGRKTQTRRPVKLPEFGPSEAMSGHDWQFRDRRAMWQDYRTDDLFAKVAPYRVGDRLYVRERFAVNEGSAGGYMYWADYGEAAGFTAWDLRAGDFTARDLRDGSAPTHYADRWTPSIHMPKHAARIWLEVTRVRVELVRDISESDALAEGIGELSTYREHVELAATLGCGTGHLAREVFGDLWISLYGPDSWRHGYCWVYEFRRIDGGAP